MNAEPAPTGVCARHEDANVAARACASDELVPQSRLALPRRTGHQHRARDRFFDAFAQRAVEQPELLVSAHERRRLAEQGP